MAILHWKCYCFSFIKTISHRWGNAPIFINKENDDYATKLYIIGYWCFYNYSQVISGFWLQRNCLCIRIRYCISSVLRRIKSCNLEQAIYLVKMHRTRCLVDLGYLCSAVLTHKAKFYWFVQLVFKALFTSFVLTEFKPLAEPFYRL